MKESIVNIITLLGYLVIAATFIGFFQSTYLGDLFGNFRFQYFWMLLLVGVLNLLVKEKRNAYGFLIACGINLAFISSSLIGSSHTSADYKLLYANVLSTNEEYGKLLNLIKVEEPDFVALVEVNKKWEEALSGITMEYPHKIVFPRRDNFGIALYSKHPFGRQEIFKGVAYVESIYAEVILNGKNLNLVLTHPLPPANQEYWEQRNQQFQEISNYLTKLAGNKLLLGDFNTTPWSTAFKVMREEIGLTPVNTFRDTWPVHFPPGFRIKLDHVLISDELKGMSRVLPSIGSDHFPLMLEFSVN